MADKESSWKLNLDAKEFFEKIAKAKDSVNKLGDSQGISDLADTLLKTGKIVGVLGAAFFALKSTMEKVFDGEEIKAINTQFELLTKNAGLATDTLREGLVKASAGLVDDTDLLKAANGAIIDMGESAQKLPELMDLARKSTAVFGGELINNFEGLTRAIATGNQRALKQLGLTVDVNKAQRDYAKQLGITVTALSETEKKQAILNAAIAKGETAFAGVDPELKKATNSWQRLKVEIGQVSEAFSVMFEKAFGSTVRGLFDSIATQIKGLKETLNATFGSGADKTEGQIALTTSRIAALQRQLAVAEKPSELFGVSLGNNKKQAEFLRAEIDKLTTSLGALKAKKEEQGQSAPGAPGGGTAKVDEEGNARRLASAAKFEQDILNLRKARVQAEIDNATTLEQADAAFVQQGLQVEAEASQKIKEIKSQLALGEIASAQHAADMIEQIEAAKTARLESMEDSVLKSREAALDRYQSRAQTTSEGIARAFKVGAQKAAMEMDNFGKRGQQMFDSFGNRATDALEGLGNGTKTASEAMSGFFLGMLGDWASAEGKFMMLSGIWPPNPVAIAGGAALITLGGFLKGKAGGSSGSGASVGGGGGAGGAQSDALNTKQQRIQSEIGVAEDKKDYERLRQLRQEQEAADREELAMKKKAVSDNKDYSQQQKQQMLSDLDKIFQAELTRREQQDAEKIQRERDAAMRADASVRPDLAKYEGSRKGLSLTIQGNYFDTDESRRRLTEMLREEGDITDFRINKIAGT